MMRKSFFGVLACFALASCVVPDAGDSETRCEEASECMPDQVCYRGFCVDDGDQGQQVDPVGGEDAGPIVITPDAAPPIDAAPEDAGPKDAEMEDAGATKDAGAKDAGTPKDAGTKDAGAAKDAGTKDAGKDASVKDAGKDATVKDAGNPCLDKCKKNDAQCKKCVQDTFGDDLEDLCGDDDDAAKNPFCIALCLSVGSKCGGMP